MNQDEYVTMYTLERQVVYGDVYTPITDEHGDTIQFTGNVDKNSHRANELPAGTIAVQLKLIPISWNDYISVRWNIYGCDYVYV